MVYIRVTINSVGVWIRCELKPLKLCGERTESTFCHLQHCIILYKNKCNVQLIIKKEPDYVKNEFAGNVMIFIKKLIENHPDKICSTAS